MSTMLPVTGDTYPHRAALRILGGRWDAATKTWLVPAERHAGAQALVDAAKPRKVPQRQPGQIRIEARKGRYSVGDIIYQDEVPYRVTRLSRPFEESDEEASSYSGWVPGSSYQMVNVYAVPATSWQVDTMREIASMKAGNRPW